MVQFIFLKCNWRKGAKSIPKANLRCNFKLRVDFQESDKYLQRTRAHVRSSVLRWLGHLENSTASQPPTELRTRMCTTRIKLLRTGLGPEVWGAVAIAIPATCHSVAGISCSWSWTRLFVLLWSGTLRCRYGTLPAKRTWTNCSMPKSMCKYCSFRFAFGAIRSCLTNCFDFIQVL